ncbi:Transcriptional repressor nrdR [Thalassoporum mexicanum PCC 7367]|uniref:transcriptional regulator NrdR n=1 Tax=Thalassoporum mexicanum TaxID=3457544 RepID=UPI00029FD9CA|nr:transcriptional regulator NrdR [Pseudanabaena sp. PCC 7367]AFY69746.1 Transcriptional repressor nrdR [Pseudanabaena sp. PCC 7367]
MLCPFCQNTDSRVLESRSAEMGQSIRRRRECLECRRRFTTYERIEFVPITVSKRDGKVESFDKSKLLRGVVTACEKTGVGSMQIEAMIDELEAQLQLRSDRHVTSAEIGEMVLEALRSLSEVAYVRFASVYRQFQGVTDFAEALRQFDAKYQHEHQHDEIVGPEKVELKNEEAIVSKSESN